MSFLAGALPTIGNLLFGGLGLALNPFGGSKKRRPALRTPVEDPAAEATAADDALRRRKGAAADMITGVRGAEAGAGSVGRLVVGS